MPATQIGFRQGGGITRIILLISANTTGAAVAGKDYVYLVSGTTTITLPTAVGNTNMHTIKNSGLATVTIGTTSSQTIDGTTSIVIASGDSVDIVSDNANWYII